jgi:glycosyltransferase involved in cell wall biosynthesis
MPDGEKNSLQAEISLIRESGLFLSSWYTTHNGRGAEARFEPVEDFCRSGWRAGARPNPYFQPGYYLAQNPDIANTGMNPLLHYIVHGDREGRDPCPFFAVKWYREHYGLSTGENCLRHFLERRFTGQVSPVPLFDAAYYLDHNPDVAAAGEDPFEHFLAFGHLEFRNPSASFDIRFYAARYKTEIGGENPLLHYLVNRERGHFLTMRPDNERLIPGAVKRATRPAADFEEFWPVAATAPRRAKVLAYYLPQFHSTPENDAWWGKGFTDWTNLLRAVPRFAGHLQPRVPRDLGFYSLENAEVLRRQIELAKGAGLFGFAFYFYWFNGKRLLDGPLQMLLADSTLDFPFCVIWANENWTRRWDGMDRQILISQEYRESDDASLVDCFAGLFADPRYIRIGERPLLMIYRANLIPNAAARIRTWRQMFQQRHDENPLIVMSQSFEDFDPTPYGLDGAVEFPPHKLILETAPITDTLDVLDPEFSGAVFAYEDIAAASLATPEQNYPLIKGIVPGWDNDPRREGSGSILHASSPAKYQSWLESLINMAATNKFHGESLVCVNAWNEWAEGAFLEPDLHFGAAYLNATGRAICGTTPADQTARILLVGHDAAAHGAQLILLHLARQYRWKWGIEVYVMLLGAGPLLGDFEAVANVVTVSRETDIDALIERFIGLGIRNAIVNSAASAKLVKPLNDRGIETILLIHEMPQLLKAYNLEVAARAAASLAKNVIFPSSFVRDSFIKAVDIALPGAVVMPQGNFHAVTFDADARDAIRLRLGIKNGDFLMIGSGFADLRKGFDLFLQISQKLLRSRKDVHCLWAGDIQPAMRAYLEPEIETARATGRFHLVDFTDAIAGYFAACDVFALTSREDPFPTVAIEALAAGAPCVAFDQTGGIPDFIRTHHAGRVAVRIDADDFSEQVIALFDHKQLSRERPRLQAIASRYLSFENYSRSMLQLAQPALKTVSVCILNYNYAQYLPARLDAVFSQTYPVCEVLFFDDGSTDDSVADAEAIANQRQRALTVIANEKNTGAIFAQWRRAVEAATGDYIWIAEADDACEPNFLAVLANAMGATGDPLLAFTDSRAIDDTGETVMPSYKNYYLESGAPGLQRSGIWPAQQFAEEFLANRNLILNVSAVLWRREALLAAMDRCGDLSGWRLAGDWRLYVELLAKQPGDVVYVAEPLNIHRRHHDGVTQKLETEHHVTEIQRIHEIVMTKLALDAPARAAQLRYIGQLREQFGLSKKPKVRNGK